MQWHISLSLVLSFASIVLAIPAAYPTDGVTKVSSEYVRQVLAGNLTTVDRRDMGKRTTYGFYQCSQEGFVGDCIMTEGVQDEACRKNLVGPAASMCPDQGLQCTLYENFKCSGEGFYPLGYPGIPDFKYNVWWDAVATRATKEAPDSYRCQVVLSSEHVISK